MALVIRLQRRSHDRRALSDTNDPLKRHRTASVLCKPHFSTQLRRNGFIRCVTAVLIFASQLLLHLLDNHVQTPSLTVIDD